jgi:DNA (cytosine-5)-methyltransferase 1
VKRPRLLDLFCGAGGCAMGYHRAGFEVVGIDCEDQPAYPFLFARIEALWLLDVLLGGGSLCPDLFSRFWLKDIDVIHASPPCQGYCRLKHLHPTKTYPMLIPRIRELLSATGKPYVIENVPGAPLNNPVRLCGSSFGLRVRRHRLFESNVSLAGKRCDHKSQGQPLCVAGSGGKRVNRRVNDRGGACNYPRNILDARDAMGIEWMTRAELSQAIPPPFTEYIGSQLIRILESDA